uniref:Biotin--acetyl-CoA-carboxylase ligase (BirA) n=1 Tax=uncultured marine thaumarchaeote KM3_78_D07 TaxID=1456291 RepID=A0A075HQG3_9ARCH|nr:biotin--acetyl-CoA-carboxylase ligase (birA) [uncultured marine thaumarchaeote KM3_78_D07]
MMLTSFDDFSFVKILSFLKAHRSEFLSGQDMSDILKISRVAVWKDIKKIRALGYKIESKQNIGYRLVDSSKLPLPWEIKEDLNTKFLGNRIYYFDTIDTTQNFAMKIASEKNEDGSVVISKKQTGGRGRMKRKWKSPVGGIWMSIIINPKFDVTYTTLVPIATSLALCIAIEKILKINTKLKWPNDITLKKKKVAGVLINVSMISNQIENMVLGIGINFKINPNELENSIKKTPNFYGVGTLVKKNQSMTPLIKQFLYELENVLQLINSGQIKKIRNRWTKRSSTIGRNVSIVTNEGRISGKAIRIDNEGGLIISKNKKTHRVIVGDVKE